MTNVGTKGIKNIGYQGTFGSFSYLVAKDLYPNDKLVNYDSFLNVVNAIIDKKIDYGIIPIENSYAGRVTDVHNIFLHAKLHIVGEKAMPISHCLCGIDSNLDFKDILYVHSHEQALKQCTDTIKQHLSKTELIKEQNTAFAAEIVSQINNRHHVAICSEFAASYFNLKILKKNIQDSNLNTTLFLILARKKISIATATKGDILTSISFEINNIPSALYDALGCFAKNDVNIIKLESYIPNVMDSQNASFFVTIEGNEKSTNVKNALKILKKYTNNQHIFGSYYKNRI